MVCLLGAGWCNNVEIYWIVFLIDGWNRSYEKWNLTARWIWRLGDMRERLNMTDKRIGSWSVVLENIWLMTSEYVVTALFYSIDWCIVPNLVTCLPPFPYPLDWIMCLSRTGLSWLHELLQNELIWKRVRDNCLWGTPDHQNQIVDGERGAIESEGWVEGGGELSVSDQGRIVKEQKVLAKKY